MSAEPNIQGVAFQEIADRFGTPFYAYDGEHLRENYRELRGTLHPGTDIFYSLKANPNISVFSVLRDEGAGAEVSSMVELKTAQKAGAHPKNIIFLGPGKSRRELEACVRGDILAVVCESVQELELLDSIAAELGRSVDVMLRVNPEFSVKGSGLTMGGKPRQFGIDERALLADTSLLKAFPGLRCIGVHVYMGTRILAAETVAENTRRIFDLSERIANELDFPLEVVDIGGGLGVAYFSGEEDVDLAVLGATMNPLVERFRASRPGVRVIMELGRYLVAAAGTYVVSVRYTKSSMGEHFAVTDGGTNHHMAAVGIGSFVKRNFPIALLSPRDGRSDAETGEWNVTGPLCTPNDTLGKRVPLPELTRGDLLGVGRSGAYGPTASPVHFLSHGYPAEVLVLGGRAHMVRHPDQAEETIAKQVLLPELE